MSSLLTSEERSKLLLDHKSERDKRVADRIKVIVLFDRGWNAEQIAEALLIDDSTVRRHLAVYEEEKRLSPDHKGSTPILTKDESTSLSWHIEANCYRKAKDIQEYVRKTYDKNMSVSTLTLWLKNNNFSYKKPKLLPKGDLALQEQFVKDYNKLMNEASLDATPVLFGDSVHPSQQTRPAYGWIKKGQDKVIETHSGRKRLNIMGAINLETMKFEYKDFETINGEATIEFIKQVEEAYPDAKRIELILDNAGYHKCKEVMKYLETSRVNVHFLPPRSPNLNSIERLWKIMHEFVSNNKTYLKFQDFKKAIFDFFDNTIPAIFDTLVQRLTDDFHLTPCAK